MIIFKALGVLLVVLILFAIAFVAVDAYKERGK